MLNPKLRVSNPNHPAVYPKFRAKKSHLFQIFDECGKALSRGPAHFRAIVPGQLHLVRVFLFLVDTVDSRLILYVPLSHQLLELGGQINPLPVLLKAGSGCRQEIGKRFEARALS